MQPMLNTALRAARAAANIIIRSFQDLDNINTQTKSRNDFVTEVDRASEKAIIKILQRAYPDHAFFGEEYGYQPGKNGNTDYVWIIDPLDGTTNFIHGIEHFAISIACQYRGRIEHAVILDPLKDEAYCASRGHGATLNNKRIYTSNRNSLDGALIGTGIPFTDQPLRSIDSYFKMMDALLGNIAGIRRYGAAALDLAYVASGKLDAFWEYGLKNYDMAAGSLIIREARGLCCDFNGGDNFLEKGQIICANPKLIKEVLRRIHPFIEEGMTQKNIIN